jgi:apolipoprotein N-acyltransferase
LAALSGGLLAAASSPVSLWPLAWVALVPLLLAVPEAPDAKAAANLGAVTGLVFYPVSLHWLVKVFGPMAGAFWCVFALFLALFAALLWRLADEGAPPWLWAAGAAVFWAGPEYFRSEVWRLNCSWLALGYTQTPVLPFLQSCALWGVYGLSAWLAAFNAAAALALRGRRRTLGVLLAASAVLWLWGARRLAAPEPAGRTARVALVQDESYDLGRLSKLSARPAALDADLLVWPEYSFTVAPGQEDSYRKLLARRVDLSRRVAVVGAAIFPDDMKHGKEQNFAWVLGKDGVLLGRHDKMHPIPYVEHLLPPHPHPRPVDTPLGRLGVLICYDLDFEDGARVLARQGAEVLVVPDLDPAEWKAWQHRQHSDMTPVRAVESGLWIARDASSGFSQIVDPRGRVRAELASGASGVLAGTVILRAAGTVYARAGHLTGPLLFALTVLFLLGLAGERWALRRRRGGGRS